jgi:hypothetical protein
MVALVVPQMRHPIGRVGRRAAVDLSKWRLSTSWVEVGHLQSFILDRDRSCLDRVCKVDTGQDWLIDASGDTVDGSVTVVVIIVVVSRSGLAIGLVQTTNGSRWFWWPLVTRERRYYFGMLLENLRSK